MLSRSFRSMTDGFKTMTSGLRDKRCFFKFDTSFIASITLISFSALSTDLTLITKSGEDSMIRTFFMRQGLMESKFDPRSVRGGSNRLESEKVGQGGQS